MQSRLHALTVTVFVKCLTRVLETVYYLTTVKNKNTEMSPWEQSVREMSDWTLTGLTESYCSTALSFW